MIIPSLNGLSSRAFMERPDEIPVPKTSIITSINKPLFNIVTYNELASIKASQNT